MAEHIQDIDRTTREYKARVQAIWTGVLLAVVLFAASFVYFSGVKTDMVSHAPSTTGSTPQSR